MTRKLRTSPNFSLSYTAAGACFAVGEVEPYPQYWLDRRERLLFALFGERGGAGVDATVAQMAQMAKGDGERERRRLARAIAGMEDAGLLIDPAAELSRYDRTMARVYLDHRPFPTALATRISARIGGQRRVLDLAAGPGSLALELAARGGNVTIMELSRGFVAAARAEARARGLPLETIHESCNRLAQHDGEYDAITISQAIHWLDDVALCRGVARCLAAGGSFFIVHGALSLADDHPLAHILGDRTPLGNKQSLPFEEEARALFRRVARLFEALDTPQVARHDPLQPRTGLRPIVPVRLELSRQRRPIDQGFASAFLSPSHIAALDADPIAFWQDIGDRCRATPAEGLLGTQHWAVMEFSRAGEPIDPDTCLIGEEANIPYP